MAASMGLISDCGVYRTKDPIKNFKIRVKLEKVKSTGLRPACEGGSSSAGRNENEMEMQDLSNLHAANLETEEFVFTWQEKIFSQREYQLYSNEAQCSSALELKYNQMVKGLKKKGRPTKRLFCYVDDDEAEKHGKILSIQCTALAKEEIAFLRLRKNAKASTRDKERDNGKMPTTNLVIDSRGKLDRGSTASSQTMYIMAELGLGNGDSEVDDGEVLLCTISADSHGAVLMKPDFSFGRKPYEIESRIPARGIYRYTVEHASDDIGAEEKEQEGRIFQDLYARHSRLLSTYVGHELHEPPNEMLQLYIFGEMVSAQGFHNDGLYVNFFIELPQDWAAKGDEPLYGVTQTCKTKCEGKEEVAYFSFPFQHHLICPLESLAGENTGSLPRWPQLCFQVMSRDSWNRFRTEGYGYVSLPTTPGAYTHHVHTWRPINASLDSRLRDYFIGSSPELQDLSTAAVSPALQQQTRMSRYGMQTENGGGTVSIRIHAVQQCQMFSSSNYRHKLDHLAGHLRSSTLQSSVTAVLEAFQRARQRMLAARENLHF